MLETQNVKYVTAIMLTFIISLWDKQRDLPGDANHKESIQHRHQQPKALAGEIPSGQKWSLLYHKPIWIENGLQGTLVKLLFSENRSHGAIKNHLWKLHPVGSTKAWFGQANWKIQLFIQAVCSYDSFYERKPCLESLSFFLSSFSELCQNSLFSNSLLGT